MQDLKESNAVRSLACESTTEAWLELTTAKAMVIRVRSLDIVGVMRKFGELIPVGGQWTILAMDCRKTPLDVEIPMKG
jgi:hypothetical protein